MRTVGIKQRGRKRRIKKRKRTKKRRVNPTRKELNESVAAVVAATTALLPQLPETMSLILATKDSLVCIRLQDASHFFERILAATRNAIAEQQNAGIIVQIKEDDIGFIRCADFDSDARYNCKLDNKGMDSKLMQSC
jgi:hypothetical protein